jgi:hypothetical protein
MRIPKDINDYLRTWTSELGERILQTYPPLQGFADAVSPLIGQLLRKPFPTQSLAVMGVVKRWNEARGAAVTAECGTGKTLISLGAVHVHSGRKPFTALTMVPPQLVEKWAREAFLTLPRVRVFFIDGLRTPTSSAGHAGVNEVQLRHGRIVREGLRTTLTELRLGRQHALPANVGRIPSAGFRPCSLWGVIGENSPISGAMPMGLPDAGGAKRVLLIPTAVARSSEGGERLLAADFKKAKLREILGRQNGDESKKLRGCYTALYGKRTALKRGALLQ